MGRDIKVIKRNGVERSFKSSLIFKALTEAAVGIEDISQQKVITLSNEICKHIKGLNVSSIAVSQIEDIIKDFTVKDYPEIYKAYTEYHKERERTRVIKTDLMQTLAKIAIQTDRDNANVGNNFSSKLLRAASVSNKYLNLGNMPKNFAKLHENGDIYYHDLDSYTIAPNCLHIPTSKILDGSFNTGYGTTRKPKDIRVAAELSCILLQSSQNDMFGGQSHPNFDNDLAPYVEYTRQSHIADYLFDKQVEPLLDKCSARVIEELEKVSSQVADKMSRWLGKKIIKSMHLEEDKELCNVLIKIEDIANECWKQAETGCYHMSKQATLLTESYTIRDVRQAMQSTVYNLNTMHSRAGSQVPFSSLNIGLPKSDDAALICKVLLEEYEKGLGKGEQPIFPNIIFRVKKGVNRGKGAPYYYLFKIACRVAAKRMNPTFMNMDADFNLKYYERGIIPATMGCRTYICSNINGQEGPEARGNNAPATINLPRIGILSRRYNRDLSVGSKELIDYFKRELSNRIELTKESLIMRFNTLKKLRVKDLPFSAGQGLMLGSEGLNPDDSIEPILMNGTWGIGFIGLAETLILLMGKHHGESEESQKLGLEIVKMIRDKCDEYTKQYKMNFSCYATPAEGLSSYFTDIDRDRFGEIQWVTSKGFYTNSFHIPVDFQLPLKKKFEIEAPYHALCNGGHISYGELDGTPTGEVIEKIICCAYDTTNISYIGLNFHLRYCKDCGTTIVTSEWRCPHCGSTDIQGISRVTGYLSLDERFGKGKTLERSLRRTHDGNIGRFSYNDVEKITN